MNSRTLARHIAQAAFDKKGVEIAVLDLRKLSSFTDFFVIVTGRSDRQIQAIAQNIEETLKKKKQVPLGMEGFRLGRWILVDYGSVVAHVFYEEERDLYNLEKLWSEAPLVQFRLK